MHLGVLGDPFGARLACWRVPRRRRMGSGRVAGGSSGGSRRPGEGRRAARRGPGEGGRVGVGENLGLLRDPRARGAPLC